jgi:hypothetical protein
MCTRQCGCSRYIGISADKVKTLGIPSKAHVLFLGLALLGSAWCKALQKLLESAEPAPQGYKECGELGKTVNGRHHHLQTGFAIQQGKMHALLHKDKQILGKLRSAPS